ncbi:guanyltransferase [Sphaerisporangium siamense]|uniref:NDP-sugar pyrophosphorylase family protein n=1 Tax=Sphaerisporangium siamense TaxID=795645 RepID=A0A7W7D9X5_9ACTN|nr:nucleotidyltransferase family protein [Sphaerisporangium siamense]MBB4701676.1 NDP-sugar pyrophosphorylase family protein [Sphaerisporangium siamense]GII84420.1 guanyltransferase [Sphaerisporangium siamense]
MVTDTNAVRQAVILAGGQATRLRPYTDDRPKAMIPVAERTILEWQLDWLAAQGIEHVVVSCGYRADVLQDHLSGHSYPMKIEVAVESEPLGRGGALRFAADHLPGRGHRWLALNGDVLTRFPLEEIVERHVTAAAMATIALAQYRTTWGIATLDDHDRIVGFVQSPRLPYWINGGIYVFEPDVIPLLPEKGDHEDTTFPQLAVDKRLAAYKINGYWRGVDTIKDVNEATEEVSRLGW